MLLGIVSVLGTALGGGWLGWPGWGKQARVASTNLKVGSLAEVDGFILSPFSKIF